VKGGIWRILPLTCSETATFLAKFCERPLLSVMNVGTERIVGLQKIKLPAGYLTLTLGTRMSAGWQQIQPNGHPDSTKS
jgi:hypothetical protein